MMQWIEVNGVSLRYELSGKGAETLVLVHELGGSLESWDEVLPELQKRFRVLRYDQRGFGLSEKVEGTLKLDDMTADLAALLDALGISQPCLVTGMALGSAIALAFAIRCPEKVKKLAIPSPATGVSKERAAQSLERADAVEREGMRAQVQSSLDRSYPEVLRGNRDRFERYRNRWIGNDPGGFAAINRMLVNMDMTKDFAKVKCPTLVIGSQNDLLRPPAMIEGIAKQIPGAKYVETASGHFMAVQTPELYLETVLPFLTAA
jgi:3-oxoadipate enol-lactonase